MTSDQTLADREPVSSDQILANAIALGPFVRKNVEEIEGARTLTAPMVKAMHDAGIFRMSMPSAWGGPELDPLRQFEVIEALSVADGSVGWCAYINSTGGYFTSFLEADVARAMYPSLDIPTGGQHTPVGRAEVVDGGYRINGRWTFGSGVKHSGWMACGCIATRDGEPVLMEDGKPQRLSAFASADQLDVIETWNSMGLRGTGSHDYTVTDLFVPTERTFDLYSSPVLRTTPLFQLRTMFLFNHAAVALGIARNAVDSFAELTLSKRTNWGPMHEQDYARSALARADGVVRSARAYCMETLEDIYGTLTFGGELSVDQRAGFRLAITHAHRAAVEAVDGVFAAAGTTAAVRLPSVLERCFRDVHVANQHLIASPKSYSEIGGMLLGAVPDDPNY
ncbi:Flavin-dependent monooxygenase, oxygenase subunit HsaA [Baekduia alba]|nr:Flavin-dependent monooxygenase, oxygenase subunit HsaA [Baekduia alba]